jgi:hypothetical protein
VAIGTGYYIVIQLRRIFSVNDYVNKPQEENVMKKTILICILISFTLILSACAAGPNQLRNTPDEDGEVAGFWRGIWHGLISPITFIISLFNKSIYVFEVHNNGGWYTFGFLLGASMTFGGSGSGAAYRRGK